MLIRKPITEKKKDKSIILLLLVMLIAAAFCAFVPKFVIEILGL